MHTKSTKDITHLEKENKVTTTTTTTMMMMMHRCNMCWSILALLALSVNVVIAQDPPRKNWLRSDNTNKDTTDSTRNLSRRRKRRQRKRSKDAPTQTPPAKSICDSTSTTAPPPNGTLEPPLPGVLPGTKIPKILIAVDIDYPPYAELGPPEDDFPTSGFGPEFAEGLETVCDIDVVTVQTQWSRCWNDDRIGEGLGAGEFHGCATYTHASGIRNRYLEFSDSILDDNKAAGLLVRLNAQGNPIGLDGNSDLDGIKVVDVKGFAPTAENLALLTNHCTGQKFVNYKFVPPNAETDLPNDDALRTLLDGDADAMFVYADQAQRFSCAANSGDTPWDCTMWDGLGTTFAYIHTGHFDWFRNGTTLTISKKGSGLADILNPCIAALKKTELYYDLCVKYGLVDQCATNEFFPLVDGETEVPPWDTPTNQLTTDCSSGYCACPP